MNQNWWEKAIVYQIYPKSFKDSNNDGIGDLKGIIESLDYIKELGVDTLWLNPIFISPQVDNGYDISNYYAIDEIFGDLDDVEVLIEEAHKRDLKIIFDLVLNHTSSEHPWFQEAIKGPQNIYRDYYLWADEPLDGSLPNNWESFFGGSVWEKDYKSEQYYFHLFDKQMPDLNWANPEVKKSMIDIAKFWLAKGIDGFRLDAFIHMVKDDFTLNVSDVPAGELAIAEEYYANLPEVKHYLSEFISEIKKIKPDAFILGEAASATPQLADSYIREDLCSAVISFDHFDEKTISTNPKIPKELATKTIDAKKMKENLKNWQEALGNEKYPTLYWNNHDMPRMASRFGNDKEYRDKSVKSLATAMYLLRGIPVILYGEEIGMKNLEINDVHTFQSPKAINQHIHLLENGFKKEESLSIIAAANKEASRGVMQWDQTDYAGFSSTKSWIGENVEKKYNVSSEKEDKQSILHFYQELLKLKKEDLFSYGEVEFLESADNIIAYKRQYEDKEAVVICNLTEEKAVTPTWLKELESWQLVIDSGDSLDNEELEPYVYKVYIR
ncbi:glycoside hydrolase family 13 protein [Vagococcus carniphilus]|uniref:glycoside hydrolase family 13 protein n=1 Tax=Vagococcus carniphilus TaxID=218144 RepID=UPI003BAABE49